MYFVLVVFILRFIEKGLQAPTLKIFPHDRPYSLPRNIEQRIEFDFPMDKIAENCVKTCLLTNDIQG